MKVMVCIPHFYPVSFGKNPVQGSSQDAREKRAETVRYCLTHLKSMLASSNLLMGTDGGNIANRDVSKISRTLDGDVYVCTHSDNHVLDLVNFNSINHVHSGHPSPMLLGCTCRRTFLAKIEQYDLFVYIEDDTVPLDPLFFQKVGAFYRYFGEDKVVIPQRFEIFPGYCNKVYLDHPTPPAFRMRAVGESEPRLSMPTFDGVAVFEATSNHGGGCYALTRAQVLNWSRADDFQRPNPKNPMDALEQAMVPMGGQLPLYKTAIDNIDFLEVHHVPNRACQARTPALKIGSILS